MRRHLLYCLAALATCGGGTHAADDHDTKHTLRVTLHPDGLDGDRAGVTALARVVESLSINRIVVDVDQGGRVCGDAPGCVAALQAGRIDVYPATVDDLTAVFPASTSRISSRMTWLSSTCSKDPSMRACETRFSTGPACG